MNYLLFHNDIYFNDGVKTRKIEKDLVDNLSDQDFFGVCVVDVDVELASAPEDQLEKKDIILARKFAKLHPQNEYVLQDEKVGENVFQVVGIKTEKIREVYSLIPSERLKVFVPYGLALRNFLVSKNIDLTKGVIFIDDLGDEKLLTVLSGSKFSVTRALGLKEIDDVLPEIKRSQIGFNKKNEEFENSVPVELNIVTNNKEIANQFSQKDKTINIRYLDAQQPGLSGLRVLEGSESRLRFLLPEEIKNRKMKEQLRRRALVLLAVFVFLGLGLGYFLINKVSFALISHEYKTVDVQNQKLSEDLADLNVRTYRSDLKSQKTLNYANPYFKILNTLPLSYDIYSFTYSQKDHWNLEVFLIPKDGETFDEIQTLGILRNANITDYFIKNKPAKRIEISL